MRKYHASNKMPRRSSIKYFAICVLAAGLFAGMVGPRPPAGAGESAALPPVKGQLDRTGRKRVGIASFYAAKFAGRKMADGTPMRPQGDNAASKTLPLGTKALVTNLQTGRTAMVTIRDRGPYVNGRIVDLSPSTARKIGIDRKQGLAKVEVVPIEFPLTDASPGHRVGDAGILSN
jgi:rare lipoprotein A